MAYAEEKTLIQTNNQIKYEQLMMEMIELGYSFGDEAYIELVDLYEQEQQNLNIIAKVIDNEAPFPYCSFLHRIAVGQVVLNRVNHPNFPNTVYDVVNQTSRWTDEFGVVHTVYQYTPEYTRNFEKTSAKAYWDAKFVLDGNAVNTLVPDDIIWQAEFKQGKAIWWESRVETDWGFKSTTYFCR